jgi:hypothetical protein
MSHQHRHRQVPVDHLCSRRAGPLNVRQGLVDLGVDKNTTVVFPAPLMSTIGELGTFIARENAAATAVPLTPAVPPVQPATATGRDAAVARSPLP